MVLFLLIPQFQQMHHPIQPIVQIPLAAVGLVDLESFRALSVSPFWFYVLF
jgi:hypothetical protein